MKGAVILLSGGLDSATVLALAIAQGYTPHCISFQYGQRHSIELEKSEELARKYRCSHKIFDIPPIAGSALTNENLEVQKTGIFAGIPATYVPARNTIFLAFALSYAEGIGAHDIFIGVNAVDYSGYPDCRPEYIEAFQTMANLATKAGVEGKQTTIHTPLITLSKAEIIKLGIAHKVDYSLTSSCYDPDIFGHACGACDSCRLRLKGFAEAGITDPIQYV